MSDKLAKQILEALETIKNADAIIEAQVDESF